jgi:signal transduction histidine kinase
VGTLLWVATHLATEFNTQARHDAGQRVEQGLESMVERLEANSLDYSNWTDHYHALQRQDIAWLEENVGAAVEGSGIAQLVILGGGPLSDVLGWSAAGFEHIAAAEFLETHAFAEAHVAESGATHEDGPIAAFRWIGGDLWLLTLDHVVPHTTALDPSLPISQLILGVPVTDRLSRHLGSTLLLSDVRIQTVPGEEGASRALPVAEGPPVWIAWTVPRPGTRAVFSAVAPTAIALGLLLLVLGAGVFAVRRLDADLERARLVAEAANKAKSEFLTNMSHEIRTPLNGVIGMADLMASTRLESDQGEMLEAIRQSGNNLLSLVDDILDLARVEAGKLQLESRPFRLDVAVDRIVALHGPISQAKGVVLDVRRGDGTDGYRIGDETRVLQVLHNVVGNAVKFTETGRITLDVEATDADHVVFRVIDTGIGMTDEQVSRFFVAFEQADSGTARRFGGTGLGMSIVQRLVKSMEGNITVSSVLGQGTEVTIRLAVPSLPPEEARQLGVKGPDPIPVDRLKECRLLVAEDNATNRKIMALMLENLGLKACFAENGVEACNLWKEGHFDLVLMDISMPIMDGFAALEAMQRHSQVSGRPPPRAIAATANVMKDQIDSYSAAGFVGVLPKPIKRAALGEAILRQFQPELNLTSPPVFPQTKSLSRV